MKEKKILFKENRASRVKHFYTTAFHRDTSDRAFFLRFASRLNSHYIRFAPLNKRKPSREYFIRHALFQTLFNFFSLNPMSRSFTS